MKIGFISLGCSKNLVDSEKIMGMLKSGNHEIVNRPEEADIIIINTCGFIQSAKEEAIDTILEMAQYKKSNVKKLIVTGCLAQRYKEDLIQEMPEVDEFVKISEYNELHKILEKELGTPLKPYSQCERVISTKPWSAYLKIAEGCSNHCTYCAIPLIRGENVSVPIENVVEEAKKLALSGVKELVLIAQDTTKYGKDFKDGTNLLKLLKEVNKIEKLHWIRVLYMYPDEIDEALIKGMAELDKVVPYFDIPVQHASDRMLKLMNRRGTKAEILKTVSMIRETFKNPVLRTTFIVGFPDEQEADFKELYDFTKEVRWDSMGAFGYSQEEDTVAYEMEPQIDEKIKANRVADIMELQREISLKNHQEKIGEILEVLVESQDGLSGKYRGRSIYNAPDEVDGMVIFKSEKPLTFGTFVKVRIHEALPYDLKGEAVFD